MGTHSIRPSILTLGLLVGVVANVMVDTQLTGQIGFSQPVLSNLTIVDDSDAGFSNSMLQSTPSKAAYKGQFRYTVLSKVDLFKNQRDNGQSVVWTFSDLKPGTYNVYTTWVPFSNISKSVTYTLTGTDSKDPGPVSVVLDQTTKPSGGTFGNVTWKLLKSVTVSGKQLQISTKAGKEMTILDAMAIQPVDVPTDTVTLQSISIANNMVTVSYSKNFDTCVHLLNTNKQITHKKNYFCQKTGLLTLPLTEFNLLFEAGKPYMLCHGNNYKVCSAPVVVTGTTTSASSSSAISSSRSSSSWRTEYYCNGVWQYTPCSSVSSSSVSSSRSSSSWMTEYYCNGVWQYTPCSSVASSSSSAAAFNCPADACALAGNLYCSAIGAQTCINANNPTCIVCAGAASSAVSSSSSLVYETECQINPSRCASSRSSISTSPLATVAITEKEIGSTDTVVRNQDNILFKRFEVRAGDDKDVILNFIRFPFDYGSPELSNKPELKVNGVMRDVGEFIDGNSVAFGGMTDVIPRGTTVLFEVYGKIGGGSANRISMGSAAELIVKEPGGETLSGVQTNGVCAAQVCQIFVTTATSKTFTVVDQGSLYVTRGMQPRSRQLLGGALSEEILRLDFRAESEAISVYTLRFSAVDHDPVSVDRLELFKLGATTPFASATPGGCGGGFAPGSFCTAMNNEELVINKGETVGVMVRARMKTDENGAVSGESVQMSVLADMSQPTVDARGIVSNNTLPVNNGDNTDTGEVFTGTFTAGANNDIVGPTNVVTLSKILSIANANPDADNTNVPTGTSPIGQFRFTAAAHNNTKNGLNKATLSGVIFNVNALNVRINSSNFKFYNSADSNSKQNCTAYSMDGTKVTGETSGQMLVDCKDLKNSAVDTRLPAGSSTTFTLQADVVNAKTGTDTSALQVTLQNFTTLGSTSYGVMAGASHINWIDEDVNSKDFKWIEYGDTTIKSTSYKS